MLFAVPDIAPSRRGVPRCACCCCVFEHIAHAIEGGGVKIDSREDEVDSPRRTITTDQSVCAPGAVQQASTATPRTSNPNPPSIFLTPRANSIVALYLRELIHHIGCGLWPWGWWYMMQNFSYAYLPWSPFHSRSSTAPPPKAALVTNCK